MTAELVRVVLPMCNNRAYVARRLRAEGLTYAAIGKALGTSKQGAFILVHGSAYRRRAPASVQCCRCGRSIVSVGLTSSDAGILLCVLCLETTPAATPAQRIRTYRIARNMTQADLMRAANLGSGLTVYENGTHVPEPANAAKLAKALGVTMAALGLDGPVPGRRGRGRPRKQ
jgi:hypothetical protein